MATLTRSAALFLLSADGLATFESSRRPADRGVDEIDGVAVDECGGGDRKHATFLPRPEPPVKRGVSGRQEKRVDGRSDRKVLLLHCYRSPP
jgi:hypothetical protein